MKQQDREDHILSCIGEECGEIQQALGKIDRFGLYDIKPDAIKNNLVLLIEEIHDLVAVYEMFCDELGYENAEFSRELIELKKIRVEKYMEYAITTGRLEEDK